VLWVAVLCGGCSAMTDMLCGRCTVGEPSLLPRDDGRDRGADVGRRGSL
jgi:hypothetical protein